MISVGSVVQVYPGPPSDDGWFGVDELVVCVLPGLAFERSDDCLGLELDGAVAQLGEHLLCKQGVSGSIPLSSTKFAFGQIGGFVWSSCCSLVWWQRVSF